MSSAKPDMETLRGEFPTLRKWAYLDIARKAPTPRSVQAAVADFFADINDNAGRRAFSLDAVNEVRSELAELLGVPAATLAFVKNTSEGLNLAVQSLDLRAGDNVVAGEFEHEAQLFALRAIAERRGFEVRIAKAVEGRIPPAAFIALMDDKTRLCAASHVAFSNGYRLDLPALGAECRSRNVILMTDIIQSVGLLNAPLPTLGADIAVAGCHKALLGLNGTGFLYCREELIERLVPPFAGKNSVISGRLDEGPLAFRADMRRFEYGNPNFLGIAALSAAVRLVKSFGLARIEARVRDLTTELIERATAAGVAVRTPRDWSERAGIVSFRLPGAAEDMVGRLAAAGVIANAKDGYVRASLHAYNSSEDIDRLLKCVLSHG